MRRPKTKSNPAPASASGPVMPASRFPVWLLAALLVLVTIALYWPATRYDFINYDDPEYVIANPQVQGGLNWAGVKWAFSNTEQAAYWAPVMWLSHMLACQLFGLNPWGHHLINVLLHAVNTALVFLLLRQMTVATWRSLVVAALFGLHPLRVESVAWVTERKDVLSTCFGLLALIFYARYAQNKAPLNSLSSVASAKEDQPSGAAKRSGEVVRRRKRSGDGSTLNYILALLFFALGLMSKAMLVTLPFVMLLLDYWPLERFKVQGSRHTPSLHHSITPLRRLLLEKLPFFALAAMMSVVTFMTQKHGGAVAPMEYLSLSARGGNALISYCRYLGKTFWPADLAVFYPHPGYWPLAQVLLAGGLLLGLTVLFIVKRGRYPFLLMGWLWYCGTLIPVIQLVQSGEQAMADRFTYVPSLGVLILAVWGGYELTRRWRHQVLVLSVAGGVAIVLCLGLTRQQLGYWPDSETLFRHALEVTQNNYLAHNYLGTALLKKGQTDEAIAHYQEAIRLKPDLADAHNNLGNALDRKGQTDEAISQYQEAIRLKPDLAEAHYNLGNTLDRKGQTDEAISQFQEALRLKPDYANAHNNLGTALDRKGQTDEAINQSQKAIRLKPDFAEAHNNLGNALLKQGQTDAAISQYQEAIRLKPDYAEAHYNLGNALGMQGQTDAAISQYQEAVRLKPDYTEAYNNLGNALDRKGQTAEAISQYQEVIRLKPDYADAHYNLGIALGMEGQTAEAVCQFQEAIRLKPDYAEAHNNLGTALDQKGQTAAAISQFQEAIRLKPDFAEAHYNLGVALGRKGQTAAAISQFQEAIRLKPDFAEARSNLKHALETKNAPAGR